MSGQTREEVIKDMQEAADRMGLDLEDLQEMIIDVLDDCKEKVIKLQVAVKEGDSSTVKAIAHDIKGSTANYGLNSASSIAKFIEKNCENVAIEKADDLAIIFNDLSTLGLDS